MKLWFSFCDYPEDSDKMTFCIIVICFETGSHVMQVDL